MNYYNDNDKKVAAWLRELVKRGILPPGDVDDRSILEVNPSDLHGYTQVHLFAGIGGWAFALALAQWPQDRPAWTFSCPCQPLSCAGQRKGHADERHLWPAVYGLITERGPATMFGEQVASPDGREWFAGVRTDLEGAGYACGGAIMPAASVGAPHRRERIFFVADADGRSKGDGGIQCRGHQTGARGGVISLDIAPGSRRKRLRDEPAHGIALQTDAHVGWGTPWDLYDIIPCRDGKARRVESGTFPLAHGVPARMGRLRGYGNAIVAQAAAKFITAYLQSKEHLTF